MVTSMTELLRCVWKFVNLSTKEVVPFHQRGRTFLAKRYALSTTFVLFNIIYGCSYQNYS